MSNHRPPVSELDYLRPPQIAKLLGVTHGTTIGWIRAGMLAASDLSLPGATRPRFFVRREDLDDFISSRQLVTPKTPAARAKKHGRPAGSRQWV